MLIVKSFAKLWSDKDAGIGKHLRPAFKRYGGAETVGRETMPPFFLGEIILHKSYHTYHMNFIFTYFTTIIASLLSASASCDDT